MANIKENVIVIGAGIGGLSTAIRMQASGFEVTLLEKLDQIGGRGRVYKIKGFSFDAGPTIITAPFLIKELFDLAGKNMGDYMTLLPTDPYYRIYSSDMSYFDYAHPDKNIPQIEQLSPSDVIRYRRMLTKIKPIYEKGFMQLASTPFGSIWSMFKVLPSFIKLKSYKSVYSFVASYLKHDKLRQIFTIHPLLVGGNPFNVTSIYVMIQYLEQDYGVWFPKGGTHAFVQALGKLFTDIGGKIVLNAEVTKINVSERRVVKGVETKDGQTYEAPIVICNSDVAYTYMNLIDRKYRKKNPDKKYARARYSMGLYLIYFGTKKTYPNMPHHSIILGPRYKELLNDIFNKKILTEDFSAYLHVPTRSDPDLAPTGHETFYILVPVPHLDAEVDWEQIKVSFRDKVMKFLDENILPGLLDNLVVEKIFTPLDFERDYLAYKGNAFQWEPTFRQSAYFRPHNKSPDIKGLYFAGAGTHPGAGIPGVISSAKVTWNLVLQDSKSK